MRNNKCVQHFIGRNFTSIFGQVCGKKKFSFRAKMFISFFLYKKRHMNLNSIKKGWDVPKIKNFKAFLCEVNFVMVEFYKKVENQL